MRKLLIFLGPPGAGKGTQAKILAENCDIAHISTGDMLRAAVAGGTKIGQEVKEVLDRGELVPDRLMIDIIKDRIGRDDCKQGFLLDGFPRTIQQAQALQELLAAEDQQISDVILLKVNEEQLIARILKRGEESGRSDDTREVIENRISVYNQQTSPLISFYQDLGLLREVDGIGTIAEIQDRIVENLQ